jgi:pheromone shutdown protein TraB
VVAHASEQPGDEVLEVVRTESPQVCCDLGERRLLRLLDRDGALDLRRRVLLGVV